MRRPTALIPKRQASRELFPRITSFKLPGELSNFSYLGLYTFHKNIGKSPEMITSLVLGSPSSGAALPARIEKACLRQACFPKFPLTLVAAFTSAGASE
jgi:hypothetical protein